MDRQGAFKALTDYWALVNKAEKLPVFSKERRAAMRAVNQSLPVVNAILRGLAPDMRLIHASTASAHLFGWPHLQRGLQILNSWNEMVSHHWTGGGPALPLNLLDPVVGEVALPLWEADKYRQAVSDAATSLNHFAQGKLGRYDISDKDLMGQAFSDKDPEKGKPRLRCPGDPRSETVQSLQEGARAYSIGVFQAIRNPAHHLPGDWNPVTAFHHLTSLSQVAYWFRHWDVVRWSPPPRDYKELSAIMDAYMKSSIQLPAAETQHAPVE